MAIQVTKGASKGGERAKARDVSAVPNSTENLASIARNDNSDGQKYQYAVQLAKQDLGGDTSDDAEFRDLVDSYYEQMDPKTSAADMRGETMATQAIRGVGEAYDQVNDTLGDGVDWLWDNVAGGLAGAVGGLVDAATNGQTSYGDEWRQGVSDVVSPETADAIASMGTGMLLSAIPGVGVPLSLGLTAAQNSDDLYEAVTGRDAVSLEGLGGAERLGRFGSALLDTALAAAPAVGKTARYVKGGQYMDDVVDASKAARAAGNAQKADRLLSTSMKLGSGTAAADDVANAMRSVAKNAEKGAKAAKGAKDSKGMSEAIGNVINRASSSPANPRVLRDQLVDSVRALPRRGVLSPTATRNNAFALANPAARAVAREGAASAASKAAGETAKGGLKEAAKALPGRAARGLGGAASSLARNVGAGAGLNYLNYMGETGDSDFMNWGAQVAQNPSNWIIALAPKVARAVPGSDRVFGHLGLTGPSGTGRATSVAQRGIGRNVQSAEDPGLSDDEIRRRLLWAEGR